MYSNKEAENQMIFERINWNLLHLLYAFQLFPKDLLSNCVLMFIYAFEREFCFKVAKQKCVPRLVSFHLTLASRFSAFSLSLFLSQYFQKLRQIRWKRKLSLQFVKFCFSAGNVFDSSDNNLMSHLSFVAQNEMGG